MRRRRDEVDVVYVERDDGSSARSFFWGIIFGAAVALLYAPRSGEETRRQVQRRLRKLRAMAEEKVDELGERIGRRGNNQHDLDTLGMLEEEYEEDAEDADDEPSAREELERRLSEARARRRRTSSAGEEEPLA